MKTPVSQRLLLLGIALGGLVVLIVCSAVMSWRDVTSLRGRFADAQTVSFKIADSLQAEVFELSARLREYQTSHRPEEQREFDEEIVRLKAWSANQQPIVTTPRERLLLKEIQTAIETYVADATQLMHSPSDGMAQLEAAEARLVRLGLELAFLHREALHGPVAATQGALRQLQVLIFGAQFVLALLAAWTAVVTYREMIAPLRVELIESHALLARNEKLASLGVLAAGVAHEIRNPLTAIKARLFLQQKALTPGSREHKDAEFMGREIDRLDKIVTDFLRFSGPVEPECVPLWPADLLREVHELMAPKLRESSIALTLGPIAEIELTADPEQLKQVLLNLVNNAADALGARGTITLRAMAGRVTLAQRVRDAVIFEVEDDGPGIPLEVQARLFDPFFTTKPSGTGLGLSIAARIVEKHGGALHFQTSAHRGTTFAMALPVESAR